MAVSSDARITDPRVLPEETDRARCPAGGELRLTLIKADCEAASYGFRSAHRTGDMPSHVPIRPLDLERLTRWRTGAQSSGLRLRGTPPRDATESPQAVITAMP